MLQHLSSNRQTVLEIPLEGRSGIFPARIIDNATTSSYPKYGILPVKT